MAERCIIDDLEKYELICFSYLELQSYCYYKFKIINLTDKVLPYKARTVVCVCMCAFSLITFSHKYLLEKRCILNRFSNVLIQFRNYTIILIQLKLSHKLRKRANV